MLKKSIYPLLIIIFSTFAIVILDKHNLIDYIPVFKWWFITGKKLFKSTGLPKLFQNDSSRWSKKNPEKHLKNWRPHLHLWFTNKKETGPEWHPWESSKAKTTADQKEQKHSSRICQNTSWWSSRPKIFCGQTKEKFSFLKGLSPVTSGTKLSLTCLAICVCLEAQPYYAAGQWSEINGLKKPKKWRCWRGLVKVKSVWDVLAWP